MAEDKISSYYGAYQLMYKGVDTGMHFTVFFRHDTTTSELEEIKCALEGFNLSGGEVRITRFEYLDGPKGEPNAVWTCLLEILDSEGKTDEERMKKLGELSNRFSFRRYLEVQHEYTMHTSVGNSDPGDKKKHEEFLRNKATVERMGGVGAKFTVGRGYVKSLDTKEIVHEFGDRDERIREIADGTCRVVTLPEDVSITKFINDGICHSCGTIIGVDVMSKTIFCSQCRIIYR